MEEPKAASEGPYTIDIPTAGRVFLGIGRCASYAAAKRGEIPTIRVGRLKRVPVAAMRRMLERVGEGA
jgi:hypothetical protein